MNLGFPGITGNNLYIPRFPVLDLSFSEPVSVWLRKINGFSLPVLFPGMRPLVKTALPLKNDWYDYDRARD